MNLKISKRTKISRNQKGQGLIEYLIIVALIAVAGISVMKLLGQNIRAQYARVASAIQGRPMGDIEVKEVRESHYKTKDLSNFFNGSRQSDKDSED